MKAWYVHFANNAPVFTVAADSDGAQESALATLEELGEVHSAVTRFECLGDA